MRKKVVSAILCASMVAGMVVIPGVAVKADDKKLIGVTMPTKDLQRWNQDGENMKKELEAAGYEVDLQYASNDVNTHHQKNVNNVNKETEDFYNEKESRICNSLCINGSWYGSHPGCSC